MIIARANRKARTHPDCTIIEPDATVKTSHLRDLVKVVLIRSFRMFLESLVAFTDLFLLYQYFILYLYFEAYPFIFKGKLSGLCLSPRAS